MEKDNLITVNFKINGIDFSIEKKAFSRLMDYIDSLEEHYSKSEDKEEIIGDLHVRVSEVLSESTKGKREHVITLAEVDDLINRVGEVKVISSEIPAETTKPISKRVMFRRFMTIMGYIAYWVPHALWILFAFTLSISLLGSILSGPEKITLVFALTCIIFLALPLIFVVIGFYLTARKRLRSMLILMSAVEIPLFLLSVFRIFVFPLISPVLVFVYVGILFACLAMVLDETRWRLLKRHANMTEFIKLAGLGIGTLISGYILVIWSMFLPYALKQLGEGISYYWDSVFGFNPYSSMSQLSMAPILLIVEVIAIFFYISPVYTFCIFSIKTYLRTKASINAIVQSRKGFTVKLVKNIKHVEYVKPFTGLIAIMFFVLVFFVLTADYTKNQKVLLKSVTQAALTDNSYGQKSRFLKLYADVGLTKSAAVEQFLYPYTKFNLGNTDLMSALYCNPYDSSLVSFRYFDLRGRNSNWSPTSCEGMDNFFNALIFPVVYDGDLYEQSKLGEDEYKIVFDDEIQRGEKDTISSYISNTFSQSALTSSFRGSNPGAKLINADDKFVMVNSVNVSTKIDTDADLFVSEYTFELLNKQVTNQEAYIEFSIPDNAVVSDLKLGLNLDKFGIVAPKAAANLVYENSLTRSIDPALMQLVGPRTYRLRVFPIPFAGNGNRTSAIPPITGSGMQRVQFKVYGIINGEFELLTFPYTRNLDITGATKYIAEFDITGRDAQEVASYAKLQMRNGKYYYENIGNVSNLLKSESGVELFMHNETSCYSGINDTHNIKPTKLRVFFDFSYSAREKRDSYIDAFNQLVKQYPSVAFDIYDFNFIANRAFTNETDAAKVVNWLKTNEFWGYSDKSRIASEIRYESGKPVLTAVFTDDSDFEYTKDVNFGFDYSANVNNQVNLYQFGERLTAQKDELTNLVLVSGGQAILVKNGTTQASPSVNCVSMGDTVVSRPTLAKVRAFEDSVNLLSSVTDQRSRLTAARNATYNAQQAYIVDIFDAMIAVDNDWQREVLQDASEQDDAYNQKYDIGVVALQTPGSMSMPEGDLPIIQITVVIIALGFITYARKHRRSQHPIK